MGAETLGILSDSLEFRSPTTTLLDKEHAFELGKLAGLNVHDFAMGMLDAKAKVDHLSAQELIMMDTKVFKMGGKKLRVSVSRGMSRSSLSHEVIETTKAAGRRVLLWFYSIFKAYCSPVAHVYRQILSLKRPWDRPIGEEGGVGDRDASLKGQGEGFRGCFLEVFSPF